MTAALIVMAALAADTAGSWEWHTHTGEAGARRYRLFVPASAKDGAPLVVMLHGCTQDPDDFARGTRFNEAAADAGVMVAYPEQTAAHNPQKCWSWYDPAHQARGGEPALVAGIAREVMAARRADPRRVYVAGVSAGAAMAVNTAVAYPELFAAAGAHSGIAYRAATSVPQALVAMQRATPAPDSVAAAQATALRAALGTGNAVPLIVFHGAADPVVKPENGRQLAAQWARAGGLKDFQRHAADTGGLRATRDVYGPFLEVWTVEGLGHAWSGGSPQGTYTDARGPDATREMLRFFLDHTR